MSRISEGRHRWLQREKAEHPGSQTRTELQRTLGWSKSTMDRAVRLGRVPPACFRSVSGWPLWSAEQVRDLLAKRIDGTL